MPQPKSTKEFQKAYKALNPEQKAAVDTTDGPVMVVAGPGTGKTQTTALRIANILRLTDTNPGNILALTFTESAASEMRERLTRFIGHAAYYVNVSTFHGFCVDVIRDNPASFSLDPSAEPMSDLDKLKLFRSFIDKNRWHEIRPINAPYHYVKSLISAVSDLKREGVEPDDFDKVLMIESDYLDKEGEELKKTEFAKRKKDLAKNLELLAIYRLYQSSLAASKRFDFEDMISVVTHAFRTRHDLLLDYQERFHYFLVDEYQDTNNAQNQVVHLLAEHWGDRSNIMVCGDPDQSIMRFQGASIENQLSFLQIYPAATVITLRENYRSGQAILDAAHTLIGHNQLRINNVVPGLDPHLHSAKIKDPGVITPTVVSSSLAEDIFVADSIQNLLKQNVPASDIVVIYRNNADGPPLARTLAKFGINYVVQGGGNILAEPVVQRFLKILRVIYEMRTKKDDVNLFTILHYDIFGINPLDVLKISRRAADERATLFDVMTNPTLLKSLSLKTQDQIEAVLTSLGVWQDIDANSTFTQFFATVLEKSGYLNSILAGVDAHNNIMRLNTLFTEVKKMNAASHHLNLEAFLHNIDLMEANNLRIEELGLSSRDDAITLTTAHSAKGLEWDHVFLYKVYDGLWGNKHHADLFHFPPELLPLTDLSKKEKNEDERRLFYVAVTRAKTHLYVTRAGSYSQYGRSRPVAPSMFLFELGEGIKEVELAGQAAAVASDHLTKVLAPDLSSAPSAKPSADEQAFLRELVDKFSLSVTALNAYLECPYRFKLNNLLKIPRAKEPHLAFGTAVHAALESFYQQLKDNGTRPTRDFLLSTFAAALKHEILTIDEEQHRLRQGEKLLSAYYDFFQDKFTAPIYLEKFSRVHLPAAGGQPAITLTGKIDRIDWLDQSDRTIRVVDYKTGKVKTQGQILGTTQDSNGDLHRQLVFYKLLIDLDHRLQNLSFGEAELDFVTAPLEKGKSGKSRFHISDQEVTDLKEQIVHVMAEIRALHFPRTSDSSICATCPFLDHCFPHGNSNL